VAIAAIKVTETAKEGKTIFRLEPGGRADRSAPDITPLLVAFGGHRGALDDGCAYDVMFRMTASWRATWQVADGLSGPTITPWRDDTLCLVTSPLEFVQRLAALVPRPRLRPPRTASRLSISSAECPGRHVELVTA
jgi:hypothetical protein